MLVPDESVTIPRQDNPHPVLPAAGIEAGPPQFAGQSYQRQFVPQDAVAILDSVAEWREGE